MVANEKVITVQRTAKHFFRTRRIWQYDVGHVLQFNEFDLPEVFQVHFALSTTGESTTQIGTDGACDLPDMYAQNSGSVYAWVYVADAETGLTKEMIEIPVESRGAITNQEPTPVQQSAIDQAIAALNAGVTAAEAAQDAAETAQTGAESARDDAVSAATRAANSATDANASRESADQSATNAGVSERNAAASATAAAGSASAAAQSATTAAEKAQEAAGYAQSISDSVQAAQTAAQTATTKAGEASQSASTAAQKAQEAASSAGSASQSATDANTAKTAVETAKADAITAKTDAQTAATNAAGSASSASGSASAASQSATAASQSASQAANTVSGAVATINAARDSAVTAVQNKGDEVLDSIPADYSELTEDVNSLMSAINVLEPKVSDLEINKADVIISSASGDIASFDDGADGMPVKSLSVAIEPVQDLHGYDSPWPAGGGKNKFDATIAYSEIANGDGTYTATNSGSGMTLTRVSLAPYVGQTITFSLTATGKTGETNVWYIRGIVNGVGNGSSATNRVLTTDTLPKRIYQTITPETADDRVEISYGSGNGTITFKDIQLEVSSSMTDYAPYSNICPITGHTAVMVTRTGKNLLKKSDGSATGSNWWIGSSASNGEPNGSFVLGAGTYTISCTEAQTGIYIRINGSNLVTVYNKENATFTLTGKTPIKILLYKVNAPVTYWDTLNIQLELGSTASDYSAYQGTSVTLQLGQTVYGGSLDPVEGVVRVDRAIITYNGSSDETWVRNSLNEYYIQNNNVAKNADYTGKIVCDKLATYRVASSGVDQYGITGYSAVGYPGQNWIYVYLTSSFPENAAGLKTWLAENPITVCYELATPTEIQLDPVTLTTILGSNRIWADCGAVSVDYCADTKTYVDGSSGGVQDVQVNGTSILQDGIANVPVASSSDIGVSRVNSTLGISIFPSSHQYYPSALQINRPSSIQVKSGTDLFLPIVPTVQHESAFYGLAKAAGSDEKNSSLPVGQYTESAKSAISTMLNGSVSLSGTTPSITALPGVRYVCGEVSTLDVTVPASGIVDVVFESGSTATVLTITGNVRWANGFDPTSLDANTTYEINIADGLGVAASWT